MKTSMVICSTATKQFIIPCFDTSISYSEIVARLCAYPELLGHEDITSLQFTFYGYRSGRFTPSHVYRVHSVSYDSIPRIVKLLRVPVYEIFK